MRVVTWLPRGLRAELVAIDPAAQESAAAPRPELSAVLARAEEDIDSDRPHYGVGRIQDVNEEPSGLGPRRFSRSLATAVALVVVLVAGVSITVALLTTSHRSASPPAAASPLYGVTWLDPASRATVVFQPGKVHVADGCSGGDRALSIAGDHLHVGEPIGKSYTCGGMAAPPRGTPEYAEYQQHLRDLHRFDVVLNAGPEWSIAASRLTLTAPNGTTVNFTSNGTAPLSLPGSRWKLGWVTTLEPHSVGFDFAGPTLVFDRHGRFRATDSCNTISGTATTTDHSVQFHTVRKTNHHCPTGTPMTPRLIATIDTMLTRELTFQVENNTLRLIDPHTKGELGYLPAPAR